LLRPHACFYPPKFEPAGSIVSIGGPRGAALIAAGIAEPAAEPPADNVSNLSPIGDTSRTAPFVMATVRDFARPTLSAEFTSALVAALGRRRAYGKIARKF
jgi:hypothetical protein